MASNLPEEIWTIILQHVRTPDRLTCCARVNSKLAKAAAASTMDVSVYQRQSQPQRVEAFNSYLAHYGHFLTRLQLHRSDAYLLAQLPCPRLQDLSINPESWNGQALVQLGPHDGLPGVLASMHTGLTSLMLSRCALVGAGSLGALSVLVNMRDLQLWEV